ncbi:MAG: hypothetical protein LUE27_09890, partial [Clostridia bacterium]|nr:hypothetical protein [Clostridia bacterium]
SWLEQLKESPQFIKSTLLDVKKATSMVTQNVDKIAQELEQDAAQKQDMSQGGDLKADATKEKTFYTSVAYLQFSDETAQMESEQDEEVSHGGGMRR